MGTESQFGDAGNSGDGWWGLLYNNVNVPNATEIYTQVVKIVNFMCILPK